MREQKSDLLKSRVSRRTFLRGAVIAGGAAVATGTAIIAVGEGNGLRILRAIEESFAGPRNTAYGKYLTRQEDGTFTITQTPQVERVSYVPLFDPNIEYGNERKILIHRDPWIGSAGNPGKYVLPNEIKTPYAVRIAGGTYISSTGAGEVKIRYEGKDRIIGEWFAPSNEQGTPLNLNGEPLQEGEKPYYIAANFVTVEKSMYPSTQK